MDALYVRPALAAALIIDPATGGPLPASGARVPRDAHWLRALANGDVVDLTPAEREALGYGLAPTPPADTPRKR